MVVNIGGFIKKCKNYGNVKGDFYTAGIIATAEEVKISDCFNYGEVIYLNENLYTGGILANHRDGNVDIINCINKGKINANNVSAGIVGASIGVAWDSNLNLKIKNCYNFGNFTSTKSCAGIIAIQNTYCKTNYMEIENCYNMSKAKSMSYAGILGNIYYRNETDTKTNITNCYYLDSAANVGILSGTFEGNIESKTEAYMKSNEFVNLLNQNIGDNVEWKRWKQGENGYPEFED